MPQKISCAIRKPYYLFIMKMYSVHVLVAVHFLGSLADRQEINVGKVDFKWKVHTWNYSSLSCMLVYAIPLLVLMAAIITPSCLASLLKINWDHCAHLVSSNRARFAHYRYYTNISHSLYAGGSINACGATTDNMTGMLFGYLIFISINICYFISDLPP